MVSNTHCNKQELSLKIVQNSGLHRICVYQRKLNSIVILPTFISDMNEMEQSYGQPQVVASSNFSCAVSLRDKQKEDVRQKTACRVYNLSCHQAQPHGGLSVPSPSRTKAEQRAGERQEMLRTQQQALISKCVFAVSSLGNLFWEHLARKSPLTLQENVSCCTCG